MKPEKGIPRILRRSRGQVMVIFAMFLILLTGFIALSLDVGYLLAERRGVQNAVDAAAMAGGRLILMEDTATIDEQAREYVDRNGYDGAAAEVDLPDSATIEVDLTQDVEPFFLGVLYNGPWRVSAHAVATVIHEIKDVGLLALGENPGSCTGNPGNDTGIVFGGNAHIDISASVLSNGCVVFNGNATDGMIDGSVEAHSEVQDIPDDLDVDEEGILEGQPIVEDPFEDLNPPACDSPVLDPANYEDPNDPNHLILKPGRYPAMSATRISLEAGEYCFSGKVSVSKPNDADFGFIKSFDDDNGDGIPQEAEYHKSKGEATPGGVLLYFESNAELAMAGNTYLGVKTLGADWEEIVIWYTNCNKDLQLEGNNEMWIVGVIYAPCSTVELTGNSSTEVPIGAIIANRIEIGGTPTLNFNSAVTIEIEPPRVYLVE